MSAITFTGFDSLAYFEKLKKAGFTEEQAKAQVEAMQGVVTAYDESSRRQLATKTDIANAKNEILIWVIAAIIAQGGVIIAILAYVK